MMETNRFYRDNRLPISETGPIHNCDIEESVLATLMTSPELLADALEILDPDCFYDLRNREIFISVQTLYSNGQCPDMMLVTSDLAKRETGIGATDVTKLCLESEKFYDLHPHCLLLKDYSLRRDLWETGYRLMMKASNETYPLSAVHQEAKEKIDGLYESAEVEFKTLEATYKEIQEQVLINMSRPEGTLRGTPTGFSQIDSKGGLCGGDLIVIGAETSQGKTSFATALSMSSVANGDGVAFYSMEMTANQLAARIASMRSGISSSRITNGRLSMEELHALDRSMEGIDLSKMYFDERATSSLDTILMSIRSMKMKFDIKGAVVDYLQLIDSSEKGASVEQMTATCARKLKNIAKELDIWVIAISQLSRNPQNPVPSMARLRNSGQIEEAADIIALIYRPRDNKTRYPEPFSDYTTRGTAMVMIDKGRNIGTDRFICGFKAENTLFYPLEKPDLADLDAPGWVKEGEDMMAEHDDLPF